MGSHDHYLRSELYGRIADDPHIFEFLQAGSLDGIWYWDLERPDQEWMSPRMWEVLGYPPESMPHSPSAWQDLIHPDDLAVALENFDKHCADPSHPYDQVVRYRGGGGGTVWVRCRGLAIRDHDGKPIRMLGAHTDITDLVRAKQALQGAQRELERSNARTLRDLEATVTELKGFARSVSHDLREPLRAASLQLGFAVMDHPDMPASLRTELEGAVEQVQRAMALVSGMLTHTTEVECEREPVALGDVVREAVACFPLSLSERRATVQVDAELPTWNVNRAGLGTIVRNLLSNALHHAPRGGVVHIGVRDGSVLVVADQGPGIPEAERERVFGAYELGADSRGLGLGLSIVKRVVDRHDGRVWIEETPGGGATLCVSLGEQATAAQSLA